MQPLRYSINVTLDGCVDHEVGMVDEELHTRAADNLARNDILLFGRVTYTMMEDAFRAGSGVAWDPDDSFAVTIDAARKYVVSSALDAVDWNAELVRGDLRSAVEELKAQPGRGIATGGVQLPKALAELGLIDEYEFVVHPRIVGRGPALFAGLSSYVDLELVDRQEYGSGAVALRYVPRR